jgi:GTP pyrophosphokinase
MHSFDIEQENKEILNAYKGLIRACKPHVDKEGRKTIRKAFNLALKSHDGMRRKSGEPYIFHPIAVARIVAEDIGLGATSIVCALLHDVVEDTDVTLEDIEEIFGTSRANIIDGLTKISQAMPGGNSLQAENFRKILLTISDDVRVIIIKIADRLHNMSTLASMPQHKQLKIASETLFLYAPLAHRLGLYAIKSELEDLSIQYTQPEIYKEISQKLIETEEARKKYIINFIRPIKDRLTKAGLNVKITGRPKSINSIWHKMVTKKVQFEEVYDIFAIRAIIDTDNKNEKAECWKAYSSITEHYTPNPDRLRDWISVPKANGYEALHTTVMGPKGQWVEVQIRSNRMDLMAEKGIAAHWKYKEGGTQDSQLDDWLRRIREILDSPEENTIQFLDNIKLNLFASEIFVFTPKGEMKVMPAGASVLDFAYEIHTAIGNHCIGAKVNHKVVSVRHQVKNGDQVEILTSSMISPCEEWLDFLITAKGRSIVQHIVNRERRGIARLGRTALESAFKAIKVAYKGRNIQRVVEHYNMASDIDLYYGLGMNEIDLTDLSNFPVVSGDIIIDKELGDTKVEDIIKLKLKENSNFLVFGDNSGEVNFGLAKCCHPLPGDEVVAIDKEGQLDIHKTDCKNAISLMSLYGNKIVKTNWSKSKGITFMTGIIIKGVDAFGVMYRITKVISHDLSLAMRSITIEGEKGKFEGRLTVYVHDKYELNTLSDKLMELDFINFVEQTDHF